jgi:hypothetical protein
MDSVRHIFCVAGLFWTGYSQHVHQRGQAGRAFQCPVSASVLTRFVDPDSLKTVTDPHPAFQENPDADT